MFTLKDYYLHQSNLKVKGMIGKSNTFWGSHYAPLKSWKPQMGIFQSKKQGFIRKAPCSFCHVSETNIHPTLVDIGQLFVQTCLPIFQNRLFGHFGRHFINREQKWIAFKVWRNKLDNYSGIPWETKIVIWMLPFHLSSMNFKFLWFLLFETAYLFIIELLQADLVLSIYFYFSKFQYANAANDFLLIWYDTIGLFCNGRNWRIRYCLCRHMWESLLLSSSSSVLFSKLHWLRASVLLLTYAFPYDCCLVAQLSIHIAWFTILDSSKLILVAKALR